MNNKIIEECYQESIELLLANSTRYGVLASSPSARAEERNYLSIFGRDASICSLGMVASKNKKLISSAKNSLKTLASFQADNGQIPNYVKPEKGVVDFWRLGCIDATLWWLIALKFYNQYSGDKKLLKSLKKNTEKAINWLLCQEHQEYNLLIQAEASDWADIMPRSGKVLYSNVLWYKVKKLYSIKKLKETKIGINSQFYPFDGKNKDIDSTSFLIIKNQKPTDYYLSFSGYLYWGRDVDVYGNTLAILFDLPDKLLREKIINYFSKKTKNKNLLIPVLFNPIKKDSEFWRKYMENHNQNNPHQYHNGGIWPFTSSFWAIVLKKAGRKKEANKELENIAKSLKRNNWGFYEWFRATDGRAMGKRGQSWNAGMFLLAYHYLKGDIKL